MTSINIGDMYVDGKDRMKLCMPDKSCKKKDEKMNGWKLQTAVLGILRLEPKQEIDQYDEDLLKYMKTWNRGVKRP